MTKPSGNADRYLVAFNTIESWLDRRYGDGRFVAFAERVRGLRNDRTLRPFADDLLEHAELRNAIVHASKETFLAEPTDEAVADLETIRDALTSPPSVLSVIGQHAVASCRAEDSIRDPLATMAKLDYSQLPVYDGTMFVGLLTAETVARWAGALLAENEGIMEEAPVSDVLAHTEEADNHIFLSRTATVFDAFDRFDDYVTQGRRLDAVLVTHSGKRDEALLTIVALWDMPRLLKAAGLRSRA